MASAATDERSDAHEPRVAHCYPPVLPVTESLASLIALVILSRNSAKITTTNPAVMIVTITQPGHRQWLPGWRAHAPPFSGVR
jgi:hypothetical protein